jgi:hypothetical protein
MNRRQLLATLGTAAGISTIFGTSAFTSVSADRSVSVQVASDANAFLTLRPADGPNGEYAVLNNGQLELQLNRNNSDVSGNGVLSDALTQILDVFVIENQGTQEVGTRIQKEGLGFLADAVTFIIDKSQVAPDSSGNKPEPEFGSAYGIDKSSFSPDSDGTLETIDIGPGESVAVGLRIDTRDFEARDGDGRGESENISVDSISGSIRIQSDRDITNGEDVSENGNNLEAAGD